LYRLVDLADDADWVLFTRMQNKQHCLHTMLPPVKFSSIQLRPKGHPYELQRCSSELHKRTFLPRCLIKFLQISGFILVYFVYFILIFSCMCLTAYCILYLEIALCVHLLHN